MVRQKKIPSIKSDFLHKDIVSIAQFDRPSIEKLFDTVEIIKQSGMRGLPLNLLSGKIVVLLFYEPSSRTRSSFDAATKQLNGQTIVVENPQNFSSVSKGETFEDTIRVFEAYSDIIVLRHPEKGAAKRAALAANRVPIINAGDGPGEHPTQALLDLYTIWSKKKKLTGLKGLMAGDILNGRTVHSLLDGLSYFPGNEIYLLSPDELKLSKNDLTKYKAKIKIKEIARIEDIPVDCDFWYWTRVQKERFKSEELYKKVNNKFIVTKKILNKYAGRDTILMHPLPRVGEILEEVDDDPRAIYLTDQTRNGMYVRMALLSLVLGKIDQVVR
ncbi:MAG TPA: aspartate carbamoyltransferase [Patescibacteria group bacterium]|nr:aspartate carbamoyltransferase [Patescibacteria group bacterium]